MDNTSKEILKAIKGLDVGKDKFEIMKRVAKIIKMNQSDIDNFDYIVKTYLEFEGCYNIGVGVRKENRRNKESENE